MTVLKRVARLVRGIQTQVAAELHRFWNFILAKKNGGKLFVRAIAATLLITLSTCVGVVLMEGLTRFLHPEFDPSGRFELRYHVGMLDLGQPGTKQHLIKNTGDYDVAVSINRYGLRDDKDIAHATREDLVVVGDSFAWGWGVEVKDRFSDRLQALTGRRTFNLATPTDIAGYKALLDYGKSLGAQFGQVVVSVCMENDLRRYDPPASAPVVRQQELGVIANLKLWLISHSAVYVMLTTVVYRTPRLYALAVRSGLLIPNLEGISTNKYDASVIESSAKKLQALSKHYDLLVVLIPSRGLWVGPNRVTEDRVHKELLASLVGRGVKVLDLRPLFEASGAPLAYHFVNDGHWNPRGHELAAEAIARCLDGGTAACR